VCKQPRLFSIAAPKTSAHARSANGVQKLLANEQHNGCGSLALYEDFRKRVFRHREELLQTLQARLKQGKVTLGYGASTKGNVILQFCGLTPKELPAIADVNSDKFGRQTPGTHIPIISEQEAHALRPNAFLVLPWHFRQNLLEREASFLASGGEMIFPLPRIEAVGLGESYSHRM